jgi:predicted DNA-binding transcriptional regulator
MEFTPDILSMMFPMMSLHDSQSLSNISHTANAEFKAFLRQRLYTRENVRLLRHVFKGWMLAPTKPPKVIVNSWRKRIMDPEQPILLF